MSDQLMKGAVEREELNIGDLAQGAFFLCPWSPVCEQEGL